MTNPVVQDSFAVARESLAKPMDFAAFLAKLVSKDRVNAERRVTVLEAEPDPSRAPLWRRLACALMTLAPHAAKFVGKQTVQFYIADGKYRMQVFALEDLQDGIMTVYSPNIIEEAEAGGLLSHAADAEPHMFVIESSKEPLRIEAMDKKFINAGAHFKDMVGWNRKAMRITLQATASATQIETAELLCAIAAQHFVKALPPAALPAAKV